MLKYLTADLRIEGVYDCDLKDEVDCRVKQDGGRNERPRAAVRRDNEACGHAVEVARDNILTSRGRLRMLFWIGKDTVQVNDQFEVNVQIYGR